MRAVARYARTLPHRLPRPPACRRSLATLRRLGEGLVHGRQALSVERQSQLEELVDREGREGPHPFYPNQGRERLFRRFDQFSWEFQGLCHEALEAVPDLPWVEPTHVLGVRYHLRECDGRRPLIPWHVDNGANDGDGDAPVVTLSLGLATDFLISREKPRTGPGHPFSNPKNALKVRLESGDLFAFHGSARGIWHALYNLYPGSAPPELERLATARLSIMLRHTPSILGNEEDFYRVPEELGRANRFFKVGK